MQDSKFDLSQVIGWGGWDIEHFYDSAVAQFDNCAFAELGVFFGKSVIYLSQAIKKQGKDIQVFAVDTFCGRPDDPHNHLYKSQIDLRDGDIFDEFMENVVEAGVEDIIIPMRGISWELADQFSNNSLAMVFHDAVHTYEESKREIDAFWPKVKVGGWVAGDDYSHLFPGVVYAADHLHRECWGWDVVPELLVRNRVWRLIKARSRKEVVDIDAPVIAI